MKAVRVDCEPECCDRDTLAADVITIKTRILIMTSTNTTLIVIATQMTADE